MENSHDDFGARLFVTFVTEMRFCTEKNHNGPVPDFVPFLQDFVSFVSNKRFCL